MIPDKQKARHRAADKKWRQSPHGRKARKIAQRLYEKTPKGREALQRRNKRYRKSARGRVVHSACNKRYTQTAKGRAAKRRSVNRYQKTARGKARMCAQSAIRRARKYNACPPNVDRKAIARIYTTAAKLRKLLGKEIHVDHRIPLSRGGLHTESNLRIVWAGFNRRKWCKLDEELEHI